jgi:hypothetical protein
MDCLISSFMDSFDGRNRAEGLQQGPPSNNAASLASPHQGLLEEGMQVKSDIFSWMERNSRDSAAKGQTVWKEVT